MTEEEKQQQEIVQPIEVAEPTIYDRVKRERDAAQGRLDEAGRRWRQAYNETGDVMAGFLPKPKDTTDDQKRLRRVAIAQALGELVGKIGEGIAAFGHGGEGYVTAPLGLYNNTMSRLQQLQDQGVADSKAYDQMMAKIRMGRAEDRLALEKELYKTAADEVQGYNRDLRILEAAANREQGAAQRQENRQQFQAEQKQKDRDLRDRISQRSAAARAAKQGKKDDPYADFVYAMAPKGVTTTHTDKLGMTTTSTREGIEPSIRKALAPIAQKLSAKGVGLDSISELTEKYIQRRSAEDYKKNAVTFWDGVVDFLNAGYSLDEIAETI